MSQIEARILQQDYVLTCPEGQEEALLSAVQRVDLDMERIRNTGKVRARERVGVLTAVNLAFENAALLSRTEELEQALELAHEHEHEHEHEVQQPAATTPSEVAVDSVYEEAKALATELEALLTLRELELLQAQQLIARLEAALEVDSKLL